ncbi:MAG: MBL fold metallo-hydrolase [Bacteroidales bacterium]|nr:MBL fold metallo-hydrolase [Bacteroidales bacterium]
MRLDVINSGSSGNCYVLHNDKEALVLEAGMPLSKVTDILGGVAKVKGCLITHEHSDHTKYIEQFMARGIKCYATLGTMENIKFEKKFRPERVTIGEKFRLGGFYVYPFRTFHDYPTLRVKESCGYLIHHEETGTILFATDTKYLENKFANLSNILIECNYKTALLEENALLGIIDKKRAERTLETHMSLATCKETLLANDLKNVNNIVLIHLSKDNAEPESFKTEISLATGKKVYVAKKGLSLNFNKIAI